jgi:hypothetical protein
MRVSARKGEKDLWQAVLYESIETGVRDVGFVSLPVPSRKYG